MSSPRSLRARLAVAGFAAIYVAVLVLFAVTYLTEDESVTTVDGVEVVRRSSNHGFGWVELAVILLAPIAAGLAWWWAGRAVRPIERIRVVAEQIEATDLGRRIDLRDGPREIVALAASFDLMLDRLHSAATSQRELIDEISHEMRTPIAVLLANADVRLAAAEPTIELYREGLELSRRTADRMSTTLERLLTDARASARSIDRHPTDLSTVVRTVVDELRVVAAPRDVEIVVHAPDEVFGSWDAAAIARAVTNLVDNAARHAPPASTVTVDLVERDGRVEVDVSDTGPGIPPAQIERVFRRAWRGGEAAAGSGLGLSIARQIAEAHGGSLTVRSPGVDGAATTFTLSIAR
jgi:signal transduction histidine kinase